MGRDRSKDPGRSTPAKKYLSTMRAAGLETGSMESLVGPAYMKSMAGPCRAGELVPTRAPGRRQCTTDRTVSRIVMVVSYGLAHPAPGSEISS